MKILSIIAQKPSSTGSGVYLTELVKCFAKKGHKQEIICGIYDENDLVSLNGINGVTVNPIIFNSKELPFNIAGMSDEMPYPSVKYKKLANDNEMLTKWKEAFKSKIIEVRDRFKPDLIIAHHLYLLTALTRDLCKDIKVIGLCHNTDLRQYIKTDLRRDYIKENIKKLDMIFAPTLDHKNKAIELFDIPNDRIEVIGIGYNSEIFNNNHIDYADKKNKILYVGKIAKKKGVLSLVKAFNLINDKSLTLDLIGGAGDKLEYNEIVSEANKNNLKINFLEPMGQKDLSVEYNNHELFVLPSFSEGLPMVPIESMACGCKVVISDLPGVKSFYDYNIKNAVIEYVALPKLTDVDEVSSEELELYNKRLGDKIVKALNTTQDGDTKLENISWEQLVNKILQ